MIPEVVKLRISNSNSSISIAECDPAPLLACPFHELSHSTTNTIDTTVASTTRSRNPAIKVKY